jgi:hypothetical protein
MKNCLHKVLQITLALSNIVVFNISIVNYCTYAIIRKKLFFKNQDFGAIL